MNRRQNMWLPLIAGVGIGAAATGMMRGRGGNLRNLTQTIPGMNQMAGATGVNNQQNQ
ncbi:hypothetical protein [Alkalihalobacillus sp. AL-G]|uniref:hypothetical protein n=1 Tax=Alkalihalobacillus sp. AL-G TaxID=2926399 RepID=UPI00272C35FA|nr:hypothetical protein [Alkalihalobacillus sp. AL-G]WLD92170.1 hypothetical protein MOJ78_14205 [Alkalihalobacillus sp. AL-G]